VQVGQEIKPSAVVRCSAISRLTSSKQNLKKIDATRILKTPGAGLMEFYSRPAQMLTVGCNFVNSSCGNKAKLNDIECSEILNKPSKTQTIAIL
jgi:hypothetical protein